MLATEIDTHKEVVNRLATEHGIEPSVWVGKENLIPFVRESFPECAILDKNELIAGVHESGRSLSMSDLVELSSYWESVEFRDQRINLLEEFNRYPTLDNLRTLDREVILRTLQIEIFSAMKDKSPDFLLALDVPHNPVNLAAFYLAKWLGIPPLFFSGTGMLAPSLIPSTDIGVFTQAPLLVGQPESDREKAAVEFNRNLASETLKQLQKRTEIHWQTYEKDRVREHKPRRFQRVNVLKEKIRRQLLHLTDKKTAVLSDVLDRNYCRLLKAHSTLPISSQLPRHGLFTLHFQPEASALPMGLGDTFQAEAILKARRILPADTVLLVKEHPSQLKNTMEGSFGRSPLFYNFIDSLPNTEMISAFSETSKLLEKTELVFTLTGSIGIEASIRGIPVVYFGGPWWAGLPGTFHANEPNLLKKIDSYVAPAFDAISNYLVNLVETSSIPGFSDSGTRDYWSERKNPPDEFQQAFVDRLARSIWSFVSRVQ